MTRAVTVGNVKIGGGAPIVIQSMLNVAATDEERALSQIRELAAAGCQLVRLAVPDEASAVSFGRLKKQVTVPLVADIHFDYRLAIAAVAQGADKIRINPGNIGSDERVQAVVDACRERHIPIRIGVNGGSLEQDLLRRYGGATADALAESALRNVKRVEDMGFTDLVVSLKSSDVPTLIEAYRKVSRVSDYPLHVGVTEAGNREEGLIKSAAGIGALLLDGIGDTIRVSLTGDPLQEVRAARTLLAACGLRKEPLNLVACPTCGRTKVDLPAILEEVREAIAPLCEERAKEGKAPLTVAVMGCAVNGPGEARAADLGVACGDGKGVLFAGGEILRSVTEKEIPAALTELVRAQP